MCYNINCTSRNWWKGLFMWKSSKSLNLMINLWIEEEVLCIVCGCLLWYENNLGLTDYTCGVCDNKLKRSNVKHNGIKGKIVEFKYHFLKQFKEVYLWQCLWRFFQHRFYTGQSKRWKEINKTERKKKKWWKYVPSLLMFCCYYVVFKSFIVTKNMFLFL